MKRNILIMIVILSTNMFSQNAISKGSYTLNGSISYMKYSYDDNSSDQTYFFISPSLGYFFIDNLYTSISLGYVYYTSENFSNNNFHLGPDIRYYFPIDKLSPFIGVGLYYGIGTTSDSDDNTTTFEYNFNAGVDYFIHPNVALEGSLNYGLHSFKYKNQGSEVTSDYKLFTFKIGVQYFIF
ncbi:MAG: outer membrane beta-barrel protein [Melioribacteraceae bacterium]